MTYEEVLDFLFSQLPMYQRTGKVAYKANLDNTLLLDEYFGHPHRDFKTIHIGGTNGKGSVSHSLASVLQEAGCKVGLYTSPHLRDFRERIKVNGNCISEEDVISFVRESKDVIERIKPSFFEMTVAMAFDYFRKVKVDVAVVEVGLGGRLDSTNIIQPQCTVITNIGFDHTALLGDTIELIAGEKAGIIKRNTPVVIGEYDSVTKRVFSTAATKNSAPIYFASDEYTIPVALRGVDNIQIFQVYKDEAMKYPDLKCDLLGIYQQKNVLTVLKTIEILNTVGFNIDENCIYNGLQRIVENTGLLGRWQILGANPSVICDTGHNVEGVTEVLKQLEQTAYKKLHMVWGMVNDKDISKVLSLLPRDAKYYFAKPNIPRGLDAFELKNAAEKYELKGDFYESVADAVKNAKKNAEVNDLIFIGGSTFVVAEVI